MAEIRRDPAGARDEGFDVIVVGGGVYGCALLHEASRRELRGLLLERQDFGGGTTRNSLRILHGGLRYLQRADLYRHRESILERRWFLQAFSGLVNPLPCLMPLYNQGLRRPGVLRVAMALDRLFSPDRRMDGEARGRLPVGSVVSPERVMELFPGVDRDGLRSGALWYDAFMPHAPRVVMELLHQACERGSTALSYVEARELALTTHGRVDGVIARDRESGTEYEFRAPVVVNASGPGCREFARRCDRDHPALFQPTLAWNVLLDMEPPATTAIAATPPGSGSPTYFLVPWQGRVLAGTGHAPWKGDAAAAVSEAQLGGFLRDLEAAVPGLTKAEARVLRIYAGLLPGIRAGSARLATRPVILDHGAVGGPSGLWSVSGVKFTTSRRVAESALSRIFPGRFVEASHADTGSEGAATRLVFTKFGPDWNPSGDSGRWREELRRVIREESVEHLDDLVLRRTSLGEDPRSARAVEAEVSELFDWEPTRRARERERLRREIDRAVTSRP